MIRSTLVASARKDQSDLRTGAGFSLIEIIGVLAILAIGATIVVSATTKSIDVGVSKQEAATLQSFSAALQNSVLRNRYIPGASDWYLTVATEMGVSTNSVLYNTRNQASARAFLIDPNLSIAGSGLPYTQTAAGSTPLTNARIMLVSSVAPTAPLPAGGIASSNFSALWNTSDGAVPSTGFGGWAGTGDDLKIQRINLGPLFVNITLGNYSTTNHGQYRIDGAGPYTVPTNGVPGVNANFVLTTLLELLTDSGAGGTTNARLILDNSASYYYVAGVWRNVPYVPAQVAGGIAGQTNADAATLAQMISISAAMFASSPYNTHASGGYTPPGVVNVMSNFMFNYIPYANWVVNSNGNTWATSGPYYANASASQTALYNAMRALYNGPTENGCTNGP